MFATIKNGQIGPIRRTHEIPDPVKVPDHVPEERPSVPSEPPAREPEKVPA